MTPKAASLGRFSRATAEAIDTQEYLGVVSRRPHRDVYNVSPLTAPRCLDSMKS